MISLNMDQVLKHLVEISILAGEEILDVYNQSFEITLKDDLSPLTDADRRSNDIITDKLSCFYPDIPILSEEGKDVKYPDRKNWDIFWLIDPLDGTKEFIKRNGEFTVNIALINMGNPIAGIVYAPTTKTFWYGAEGIGSFKMLENEKPKKISVEENIDIPIRIVSSRSHPSPKMNLFLSNFDLKVLFFSQ